MEAGLEVIRAPLRRPFSAAWGEIAERELIVLSLDDGEGHVGYGEAAPLEGYEGSGAREVLAALEDCRGALARGHADDHATLMAKCAELTLLPQALAAVDVALWDLAGERAGKPVWSLLGARAPAPIAVNYTIASPDRAGAAAEAGSARASGYGCVKVKVGTGDDAGRVAAVRAVAGAEMAIRLDANGAWSVSEARAALRALEPAGIELCEEPVRGSAAIEEVAARVEVAVALDETAAEPGALEVRLCTAACLKLARCGGITGVLEAARRARRAGYEVYLASM